jgi:hypothetical protein
MWIFVSQSWRKFTSVSYRQNSVSIHVTGWLKSQLVTKSQQRLNKSPISIKVSTNHLFFTSQGWVQPLGQESARSYMHGIFPCEKSPIKIFCFLDVSEHSLSIISIEKCTFCDPNTCGSLKRLRMTPLLLSFKMGQKPIATRGFFSHTTLKRSTKRQQHASYSARLRNKCSYWR